MATKIELKKNLEPYCLIHTTTSAAEALETLQKTNLIFAVVGDINYPQTLMIKKNLSDRVGEMDKPLSDFLNNLLPLIVVDGEIDMLETEDIIDLAITLQETEAPGLVVYQDNEVIGVISKNTIRSALSPEDLNFILANRGLYGDPSVPVRTFICRKCIPTLICRPRQGNMAPTCPRNWLHGSMERE